MDIFFNSEDPITNVAEYLTIIRNLSGVSSASLVVSYILLERFVAGVFFDFDELVVFSSKSARRLLITAVFTASKIYDADSPKGFWSWYLPFTCSVIMIIVYDLYSRCSIPPRTPSQRKMGRDWRHHPGGAAPSRMPNDVPCQEHPLLCLS